MNNAIDQAARGDLGVAISIKGTVGEALLGAFPGLRAEFRDGDTILVGQLADQAALHGMLAQIEALGLELVELQRVSEATVRTDTRPTISHARPNRSDRVMPGHPARPDGDLDS